MSDTKTAEEANAFLNAPAPAPDAELEPSETPPTESDHQETPVVEEEPEEVTVDEPTEEVVEESTDVPEEVEKLPEEHNPDATLEESPDEPDEPAKTPQFRVDAKNLAEKWDNLDEEAQKDKLKKLKKSGRTATLNALAEELGTSPNKLVRVYSEPDNDEIAALKAEVEALKTVLPNAHKQAEVNRFQAEMQKWANHNKLSDEEAKAIVGVDSEMHKRFENLKFNPETGEKLGFNGRLKLALNQSEEVQDLIAAKKAGVKYEGIKQGLKAKLPGSGNATHAPKTVNFDGLSGEDLLRAQDEAAGRRVW